MKGTERGLKVRCEQLNGKIGESVNCKIYDRRPSPCRSFEASYEHGVHNPRCDEARAKHGLRPLRLNDWKSTPDLGPLKESEEVLRQRHELSSPDLSSETNF